MTVFPKCSGNSVNITNLANLTKSMGYWLNAGFSCKRPPDLILKFTAEFFNPEFRENHSGKNTWIYEMSLSSKFSQHVRNVISDYATDLPHLHIHINTDLRKTRMCL